MSEALVLGIDGGGSKTIVALADSGGNIRRMTVGAGVNPMDNPHWRADLNNSIEPFRDEINLSAVAAALPAYGEVDDLSLLQEDAIRQAFPKVRSTILNDVDAAHRGAFASKPGILLLSGTGSMAWARNAAGEPARSGGWGDIIGDEGSSYWIGHLALGLVSQSLDGRAPPTRLVESVFDHLRLDRSNAMNSLAGWATGLAKPRASIAALSAVVDGAARAGDVAALGLLGRAADELARHHRAVAVHCDADAGWSYAGGTFQSALLLEALQHRIGMAPHLPTLLPIGGALLVAAQSMGWPLGDGWLGRIATASRAAIDQTTKATPQ